MNNIFDPNLPARTIVVHPLQIKPVIVTVTSANAEPVCIFEVVKEKLNASGNVALQQAANKIDLMYNKTTK